jgi:hypothetical protein
METMIITIGGHSRDIHLSSIKAYTYLRELGSIVGAFRVRCGVIGSEKEHTIKRRGLSL